MDRIKTALQQHRSGRWVAPNSSAIGFDASNRFVEKRTVPILKAPIVTKWALPRVTLDPRRLEAQRLIYETKSDDDHMAFDLLRTQILTKVDEFGWRTIGIASPTQGCGCTTVTLNLAFSLARQTDLRIAVVDLNLKRPGVSKALNVYAPRDLADYFTGGCRLRDCFIGVSDNLWMGLSGQPLENSSEMLRENANQPFLAQIMQGLAPDIILFDLPPMLESDDTLVLLPVLQAFVLVAASGTTAAREIMDCTVNLEDHTAFLGIVLNKVTSNI